MRLKRAHIFGFGKWVDASFNFDDASFLCFYGKNESGKSTLQQFMFYMLFGFSPRKLAFYQPKFTSKIGGSLTVYTPDVGEVTIERVGGSFRMHLPDGRIETDEAIWRGMLNHLQKETYEAVYGFSALELTRLHEMKQGELSDLLFSVGLTGSTSIYDVERSLERRLDELFKKAGRKPLINQQINELKRLEAHLSEKAEEVLSYRDRLSIREQLLAKRNDIEQQLRMKRALFSEKETCRQFLPQIRMFKEHKKKLDSLQSLDLTFPENGISRYEALKNRLIKVQAEHRTHKQTLEQQQENVLHIEEKLLEKGNLARLQQIVRQKSIADEAKKTLKRLNHERLKLDVEIEETLKTLNVAEEEVRSIEVPFYAESSWGKLVDEEKQLRLEKNHLQEEKRLLERKHEKLTQEKAELKRQFIGFETLERWQEAWSRQEKSKNEQAGLETLLQWEKERQKQTAIGLGLTSLAAVIVLIAAYVEKSAAFFAFGFSLVIIAFIQTLFQRKHKQRITDLKRRNNASIRQMNIAFSSDELRHQEALGERLTDLERELRNVAMELLQWEEKANHLKLKEQNFQMRVNEERENYPFLQRIDVAYWLNFLHEIKPLYEKILTRDELDEEVRKLNDKVERCNETVRKFINEIGLEAGNADDIHLDELLKEQETLERQRAEYAKWMAETKEQISVLAEEIRIIKEEMDKLFATCHVHDEESFYQKANLLQEKNQVETAYETLKKQLAALFSEERLAQMVDEPLNEYELERELKELEDEMKELEMQQSAIEQQLAKLDVEIDHLESSDEYSRTMHLFEKEKASLNKRAYEWARLKLAQSLLQKAKHRYQETYFQDVLSYTKRYFSHLTGGRYINVYGPTATTSFQVEDERKMRYTVEELSKGTVDQLYVALRLAISKVMSERFVVPLMIDDAFIHFDDERAKRALQLLEKMAEDQQVIFYTCRKEFVNIAARLRCLCIDVDSGKVGGNMT